MVIMIVNGEQRTRYDIVVSSCRLSLKNYRKWGVPSNSLTLYLENGVICFMNWPTTVFVQTFDERLNMKGILKTRSEIKKKSGSSLIQMKQPLHKYQRTSRFTYLVSYAKIIRDCAFLIYSVAHSHRNLFGLLDTHLSGKLHHGNQYWKS